MSNGHIALYAMLSDATIAASVGTRIYPLRVPQSPAYPCVSYQSVIATQETTAITDPNLHRSHFQVSVFAMTLLESADIAKAVRAVLQRAAGNFVGVQVDGCYFESAQDLYDEEAQVFYTVLDFRLHWRE